MDFSTVQSKLSADQYSSSDEVIADIRLIFNNCFVYFATPTSPERLAGTKLSRYFERRLKEIGLTTSSVAKSAAKSQSSRWLTGTNSTQGTYHKRRIALDFCLFVRPTHWMATCLVNVEMSGMIGSTTSVLSRPLEALHWSEKLMIKWHIFRAGGHPIEDKYP